MSSNGSHFHFCCCRAIVFAIFDDISTGVEEYVRVCTGFGVWKFRSLEVQGLSSPKLPRTLPVPDKMWYYKYRIHRNFPLNSTLSSVVEFQLPMYEKLLEARVRFPEGAFILLILFWPSLFSRLLCSFLSRMGKDTAQGGGFCGILLF
jgi:hypothetical protein